MKLTSRFRVVTQIALVGMVLGAERQGAAQAPYALPYTIQSVAGGGPVCAGAADTYGDGCPAKQATIGIVSTTAASVLQGLGVDAQGNIYLADTSNNLIRKIDAKSGLITVFAGSTLTSVCSTAVDRYGDGCVASDGLANAGGKYTSLGKPYALFVAKNGDVYFTGGISAVQKVSAATGVMSLVAGSIASKTAAPGAGYTGDGGPANVAAVNGPRGVTVDASNNVFIPDFGNNVLRVVYGGGPTVAALITAANPTVTAPVVGNIYTICGSHAGTSGSTGDTGPASAALLSGPSDAAVDQFGNIFILDASKQVRMIYAGGNVMGVTAPVVGNIYRVAGGGTVAGKTLTAIPGPTAAISTARRLVSDARGNLYVTDQNELIWFVDGTTGWMRPIAGVYKGSGLPMGCPQQTDSVGDNCPATVAQILIPAISGAQGYGIATDGNGDLFVADPVALTIREASTGTLFAPTAVAESQSVELHYPVASMQGAVALSNPDYGFGASTCTSNGDTTQDCVMPFTLTPSVPGVDNATATTTDTLGKVGTLGLAGSGILPAITLDPGGATAFATGLNKSTSVAADASGNLLIADTANHRVLKYNVAAKTQTVLAGTGTAGYAGDGALASAAMLKAPAAVTAAADGTVYIADTGNNVVRRVDAATGVISTYAGGGTVCAWAANAVGDGCSPGQSTLSAPSGVAVDANGTLYIGDSGNNRVRTVAVGGVMLTVAGGGAACAVATDSAGDGCPATQATLAGPTQVRVDTSLNLYIADTGDNLVRKVSAGKISAIAGNGQSGSSGDGGLAASAQLNAPVGIAVDAAGSVYIADTGNHAIRMVNASTGVIATVAGFNGTSGNGTLPSVATATQLASPSGVEVTGTGAMYVLDTGNSRGIAVARNALTFNFGKVNITQSSAVQPVTVSSSGSAVVSLGSPLLTASGSTGQFTFIAATTNGCTAAQTLTPGAQCALSAKFTPTANGAANATYTFTGNTGVNSPVPSVTLSGTGATLISTTSVTVQSAPASGSPQYGQAVAVTVTVTPASQSSVAISGKVTVQVDGIAQAPVAVIVNPQGNGVVTVSLPTLSVGPHTIAATFSGDDNYGGSTATPLVITVVKSATNAAVSATPTSVIQFQSVTFSATITAQSGGVPTGTVTFASGSTTIGTATLSPSGVATFTSATLAVATYQVVAQYSGDANFAATNSSALTFVVSPDPPDYSLTGASSTVTVAQGGTIQTNVTVTPTNTLSGTVKMSCSGLPANSYCTFLPSVLAFTTATDQPTNVQVTLWTNIGPGTVPNQASVRGSRQTLWFAVVAPIVLLLMRRKAKLLRLVAVSVLLVSAGVSFTACSTNLPAATAVTPAGTSTVTIRASGPDTQSHTLPITFTVVSAQ